MDRVMVFTIYFFQFSKNLIIIKAQCNQHANCSSCQTDIEGICGWCSGYKDATTIRQLSSKCVQATTDHSKPKNNYYQCARWHNTTTSCPNCEQSIKSCNDCIAISPECGWCANSKASSSRCIEGNYTMSFDSLNCELINSNWTQTCGGKVCPLINGKICNNEGKCNITTGDCQCNDPYVGPACSCNPANCNSGSCNVTTGTCNCPENYYGDDCSICKLLIRFLKNNNNLLSRL